MNDDLSKYKKSWSYSEPATVICDLCNCDGDEKDDEGNPKLMGGALIGSYAACPVCFERIKQDPEYTEEGVEVFDPNLSFGDNVRAYRVKVQGNSDLVMEMYTPPESVQVSVPCPLCEGEQKLVIQSVEVGKGPGEPATVDCVLCKGTGFLSVDEYVGYLEIMSSFCSCGNPGKKTTYHGDNPHYWTCNDCGGIVQIG